METRCPESQEPDNAISAELHGILEGLNAGVQESLSAAFGHFSD